MAVEDVALVPQIRPGRFENFRLGNGKARRLPRLHLQDSAAVGTSEHFCAQHRDGIEYEQWQRIANDSRRGRDRIQAYSMHGVNQRGAGAVRDQSWIAVAHVSKEE